MSLLKVCPGDHQVDAPCVTCDEDARRCDLCWEENPEDQHDDLRTCTDDFTGRPWRLCKDCHRRVTAHRSDGDPTTKDDERDWR